MGKSSKKEEGEDKSEKEKKERPNTKMLEMTTRELVLAGFLVCKAFNPPAYNPLLSKNLQTCNRSLWKYFLN